MLLPISHEKMTVRRLPIVTIAIIVVTVLLHGLASFGSSGREERAMESMLAARILYLQRPSLGVCAPLKPFVREAPTLDLPLLDLGEKSEDEKRDVNERYETACKDLAEAVEGLP